MELVVVVLVTFSALLGLIGLIVGTRSTRRSTGHIATGHVAPATVSAPAATATASAPAATATAPATLPAPAALPIQVFGPGSQAGLNHAKPTN